MEIIFVRHAQTKNNVNGIIQGPENGDIDEKGEQELQHVSTALKNEHFDVFYSSDIPRCKTTANEINKFHNMNIIFTKELHEKYNGEWTSKKYSEVDWDSLEGTFETKKAPGGESLEDTLQRAKIFMQKLIKTYADTNKKIIVVSHGAFLKLLIGDLLGMSISDSIFKLKINHCSPIKVQTENIFVENKLFKNQLIVNM